MKQIGAANIANEVARVLRESVGLPMPFTVERRNIPLLKVDDADEFVRIQVYPRTEEWSVLSRVHMQLDTTIDVGVMRRVRKVDDEVEVDQMRQFAAEVASRLAMVELEGAANAKFLEMARDPLIVPEHLRELGVFTSVISLVFRETVTRSGAVAQGG